VGDSIETPFEMGMFIATSVGIPTLIFGLPIAYLVMTSFRRQRKLREKASTPWPPIMGIGFLVLVGCSVINFFMTAVGFTT